MEVPSWLCRRVYEIAPYIRLAWAGERSKDPREMNAGGYALVELVSQTRVGSLEDPRIPHELWSVTTRSDTYGQAIRCRIDRGPIFARNGATAPDWDVLEYVPVYVGRFKDYEIPWVRTKPGEIFPKFTNEMIYGGACLPLIQRWASSAKARAEESRREKAKELKDKLDDISGDGADRLWSMANQTGQASNDTSLRAERVQAHKDILEKKADFDGYYAGNSRY